MNRREFLEKFVALSSVSLILTSCVENQKHVIGFNPNDKKVKDDVIPDSNTDRAMAVYGPPPVAPQPNNNSKPIIQKR